MVTVWCHVYMYYEILKAIKNKLPETFVDFVFH